MTDKNSDKETSSIPILDSTNYSEWNLRMMFHLRSKDLLDVCETPLAEGATGPSITLTFSGQRSTINMPQKEQSIADVSGWIGFGQIISCRKMELELESVNIKIDAELLSFSILGKLVKDPKLQHYIEVLTLNDEVIEKPDLILTKLQDFVNNTRIQPTRQQNDPTALSTSAQNQNYKITYYCTNGQHNPNCTNHTKEQCFSEHPNLRPPRRNNKRRLPQSNPPSAHPSSAQALLTGTLKLKTHYQLIVNCGATHHMFNNRNHFSTFKTIPLLKVSTGNASSSLTAEGIGSINILCNETALTLENCLFAPNLTCNLVSLLELVQDKLNITRGEDKFSLESSKIPQLEGRVQNNFMLLDFSVPKTLITKEIRNLWHNFLGHPRLLSLKTMGLPDGPDQCTTCDINKAHALPFNHQFDCVSLPLNCVHIDLVRPISPMSVSSFQYFLTIVDQATSFKIVKFLKNKSDAFNQFIIAKKAMENLHNRSLKKLVSDQGGEFMNKQFTQLSESQGFIHIFSPSETPQHNGFAQRNNRTILEKARCLLNASNLPNRYWAEAINTSTFLCNIIPTPSRHNLSPHALWRDSPPRIKRLKTFGCRAVITIPKHHREWKLSPTAEEGIFLGKVVVTKHVTFHELTFPELDCPSEPAQPLLVPSFLVGEFRPEEEPSTSSLVVVDEIHSKQSEGLPNEQVDVVDEFHQLRDEEEVPQELPASDPPRRLKVIGPRHPTLITSDLDTSNILPYSRRPKALISFSDNTPRTYKSAINSVDREKWIDSISRELNSMKKLGVWDIVELDPGFKLVGTTWVFKIKKDHLGKITEHKSRLCAQGFTQSAGIDFGQTYSPTRRLNSLRTLIAFAASKNLKFHQVDIKSAFLNAPLAETVYLAIPQGLNIDRRKHCLRLNKAIYGLKQAPLAWYERLRTWLQSVGFSPCILDACVFFRGGDNPLWLYVHVDDIAIFGNEVDSLKRELGQEFEIKDLGQANLLLGIKITHSAEFVLLDQQHFTELLLDLYGMSNCKPVSTPLIPNDHLEESSESEAQEFQALNVNYRSAIGCINYLSTATRPDLSFSVSALSQFLEKPGIRHVKAFLHVLKYLKGTQDISISYPKGINVGIIAYTDADWGNCKTTRRSITGFLATMGGGLVLWKTRKQPTVSLSTAEAEYKALCDLTSELMWLKQWGEECGLLSLDKPIPIHEDNQSCINTAKGDCNLNNKRMKHINIQLHFIKEALSNGFAELIYTPTSNMLADFLTKSVGRVTLSRSLDSLGVLRLGDRGDVENQDLD
ncbi:hypothetical protein O181_074798 [Austropuccinia psidii MF-1]|uniref:Integrase catalytic domain-containing protein n=1 Tax=Austropuccinia psidii MF-1 TaxID=1389203 RepID=A0A9Q3F7L6_9BASI|nr:hypothetical protein [Austropuccinia psidii MF-1]